MSIDEILQEDLTDEQRPAAQDTAKEILCLACAGSGKSRTLAYRIARLIAEDEPPESITAFTFTEKAAESIKFNVARALERAGLKPSILGAMYIGTIHSYCQHILHEMDSRFRQFEVLDENRFKLYLISRYPQLGLHRFRAARRGSRYFEIIKEVASAWMTVNDEMISISEVTRHDPLLGDVLERIKTSLDEDEYIDFSSMIRLVVEALERGDVGATRAVEQLSHLMVDEYQDVNPSQERLIRQLHARLKSLFVVGDDDQAIYAFRGAEVRNILTFGERYPNYSKHTLSFNFRSTPLIVRSADAFAAAELGATRYEKNPQAESSDESRDFGVLWFDERSEESEWVADRIQALLGKKYKERDGTERGLTPADFAILMRSTRSSEGTGGLPRHFAFTQALTNRGIDYSLEAGGSIFDRPQVSVLRDTFKLLHDASPGRTQARNHFDNIILPAFPAADFSRFSVVMADWGRRIHGPTDGTRRRVYPQQLVHELLDAFNIRGTNFDAGTMQDIGAFSKMIQDVEAVYMSIDSTRRFQEIIHFMEHIAESGYNTGTDDVLRRPDVVTVSTVHKMKGLEFPVVFVVDVESRRFPGDRRSYSGWIPQNVLEDALQRNAYQSTREEEARLFYTAITRAERFLYVTGSKSLPNGVREWKISPFSQRLNDSEVHRNRDFMPTGLLSSTPLRRIDETVVPTSYSEIRYYLRCPKDYQLRNSFGFSPPVVDLFGFGLTVHAAVCKLHELFADVSPTAGQAEDVAREMFHLKHVPESKDPVNNPGPYERAKESSSSILRTYAESYEEDFTKRRQVEVRFEIPVRQAVISGSIDLMLHEDENGELLDATVVDFKTMEGGDEPEVSGKLVWTDMALQVQLYAAAAQEVLGRNAPTGAVHLLKDNQRIDIPVHADAIESAIRNVEWAVERIIDADFPMRPEREKCESCDFKMLCPREPQEFRIDTSPPPINIPGEVGSEMVLSFSKFDNGR